MNTQRVWNMSNFLAMCTWICRFQPSSAHFSDETLSPSTSPVCHSTVVLRFCPISLSLSLSSSLSLSLSLSVDEGSSVLLEVLRTSHFVCVRLHVFVHAWSNQCVCVCVAVCVCVSVSMCFCVCVCVCLCVCLCVSVCVYMWGVEGGLGSCSVFCPSLSLIFSLFPNQLYPFHFFPSELNRESRTGKFRGTENSPSSIHT